MDWNSNFHGISIRYKKQLVQIKTDKYLLDFLGEKGNGSLKLSEYILEQYKSTFGYTLEISKESLSIEILVHAYLDVLSKGIEMMSKVVSPEVLNDLILFMKKIEEHTEIIDSGEKQVDTNRHIFDSLVPFKAGIYLVLGRLA